MSSLGPRPLPDFVLLAVRTANEGKLDWNWRTRLDSAYEFRCGHLYSPAVRRTEHVVQPRCHRQHSLCRSKNLYSHWINRNGWKSWHNVAFCQWNVYDDGQPFSEKARLTSSYVYNFTCIQSAHVQARSVKKWSGQNQTSPTACYDRVVHFLVCSTAYTINLAIVVDGSGQWRLFLQLKTIHDLIVNKECNARWLHQIV